MKNQQTEIARDFHARTNYHLLDRQGSSPEMVMGSGPNEQPALGEQSPANEPHPFKVYTSLDSVDLPHEFSPFSMPLLDAITTSGTSTGDQAAPDRAALARIALLSNGILKRGGHDGIGTGRVIEYRAAGGTGARYHLEFYYVCGDLPDLDTGVYHYAADTHHLGTIRTGDYRSTLIDASGAEPAVAKAPAMLVITSTFWRNAWRYLERAYRHTWWDLGTSLANVLAVAAAEGLPAKVVLGFHDEQVNQLLAIDGKREAAICIVPLGHDSGKNQMAASEVAPLDLPVLSVSSSEIDFPLIWQLHEGSSLSSSDLDIWRKGPPGRAQPSTPADLIPLSQLDEAQVPSMPVDAAIRNRRSTRHYDVETPVEFDAFSTMLLRSSQPIAFDCFGTDSPPFTDQYLIVNNVANLEQGSYVLHPEQAALELLAPGNFRNTAVRLACGQLYPGDAQVNVYYLVDLEPILARYGNRGYRIAQLEGALRAGKLHLAAHALGLGAVGSTSLDDEVSAFFSPHAAGKSFMFVIVFGKRRKRS